MLAWVLGCSELFLSVVLALCLLISPTVFPFYYRALRVSTHPADAEAVVQWLASSYRQRSLNSALLDRKLENQELRHFSDVRNVFRWFPRLAIGAALLTGVLLLWGFRQRGLIRDAQWRGLILWGIGVAVIGGIALWDWQRLFAWVHHPFFGDQSWRLPDDDYSLQLFPMRFWQIVSATLLTAPLFMFAALAWLARVMRRVRRS